MKYRIGVFSLFGFLILSGLCAAANFAIPARAQQQNISITTSEGLAITALRALLVAETKFQSTIGKGEYGNLKDLLDAGLVDKDLAKGIKDGYRFSIVIKKSTLTTPPAIDLVARPIAYGKTGHRSFYLTEAGILLTSAEKDAPLSSMRPFASVDSEANPAEPARVDPLQATEANEDDIAFNTSSGERAVLDLLAAVHTAQSKYIAKSGAGAFGTLEQLEKAGLISKAQIVSTERSYLLEVKIGSAKSESPATFSVSAVPKTYGMSGRSSFYMDQTGVIRGADKEGGTADAADPVIR